MGVFLRWGILGILGVAALLYAYNASKRMAEARQGKPAASASTLAETEDPEAIPEPEPEPVQAVSPHCEVELLVARRAMDLRRQAAPLDRVLRMQEIAWQEPLTRRERLEKVATRWYEFEEPISPEALGAAVVSDCEQSAAEQPDPEP